MLIDLHVVSTAVDEPDVGCVAMYGSSASIKAQPLSAAARHNLRRRHRADASESNDHPAGA